jgi:hypothetical protein
MAWDVAAYGVTVAVLTIAVAFIIGLVRICQSLRGLDAAVERLSRETEASLIECRQRAEEAKEAILLSKQCLQSFSTFAEGARAIGEAAMTAVEATVHVIASYRERLATPINQPDWTDIGRSLWLLWRRRSDQKPSSDCNRNPGPSADPSQGE